MQELTRVMDEDLPLEVLSKVSENLGHDAVLFIYNS